MEDQELLKSIGQLLSQAPAPVRNFVLTELPSATERLMQRHQLHIDQGGVLEAELLLLLVGQSTPAEFMKALADAGISEETLKALATDVNEEIFVRLRDQERAGAQAPTKAPPPIQAVPATPVPKPPAPSKTPVPIYSPAPAAPPAYITEAAERPAVPKQVPPPPVLPGQMAGPTTPPKPTPPPPPRIEMPEPPKSVAPETDQHTRIIHTMARDMQAVKSGTDPMRVAHPAPPAWATAPSPKPPAPSAPIAPPPPATPPAPVVQTPAPIEPKAPTPQAPQQPQVLTQHLKQYGVDPYREPIE